MPRLCTLSTCSLDQHALDFQGNYQRILESCLRAKQLGARLRLGPELEIPGYGCEDHFLEEDTARHSLEVLAMLLKHTDCTRDLLCDFGLPLFHQGSLYNVRAFALNGKIIGFVLK
jgi:NAD+ synthase (glutamine-hydrolysing)